MSRLFDNVYIIGFGSIGRRYYRILNDNKFCRRTLIYDRLKNKVCIDSSKYFCNLDEIRATKNDLIIIANPAPFHYHTLLKLQDCKAPILLEKPLSNEILENQDINKIAKVFEFVHIGYNLRYHPAVKLLKQYISEQAFGDLISIFGEVSSFLPRWRPDADYSKTVSAQAQLGGGVLLELSHEIDLINFIYERIPNVSAQFDKVSCLNINVEDTAVINFSYDYEGSGVLGNLIMSFASYRLSRKMVFNCSHASLELDLNTNKLTIFKENSVDVANYDMYENRDQTYIDQLKDIHLRFTENRKPKCDIFDANYVLKVVSAIKNSRSSYGSCTRVLK